MTDQKEKINKKGSGILGALFCVVLALGWGGCAVGLYQYPAVAQMADPQSSYLALQPGEVYFFISQEAFPKDLQSVLVGTLMSPSDSQWTRKDLIREFQKKAAEIGANAIIFNRVQPTNEGFGFRIYQAGATAYRLFKQNPSEDADLSSTQYGTQDPDLSLVK